MNFKSAFVVLSMMSLGGSLAFGCSSSSSPSTTGGGDGGGGGGGSSACTKVAMADVQALVTPTVSGLSSSTIDECVFGYAGGTLLVDFYTDDADKTDYKVISTSNDKPISGIGDEAFWNEAVAGKTMPNLSAHKGSVTCTIQPPDPPDSSMTVTTTSSGFTVTDTDALAYVNLMGKVCNDIFAATN